MIKLMVKDSGYTVEEYCQKFLGVSRFAYYDILRGRVNGCYHNVLKERIKTPDAVDKLKELLLAYKALGAIEVGGDSWYMPKREYELKPKTKELKIKIKQKRKKRKKRKKNGNRKASKKTR